MKVPLYQVDAFTQEIFRGNPAAVCLLNSWLKPTLMQKIAQENNLSETAFVVSKKNFFEIRWFTPKIEVDLCGHATLAAGHVLFETGNVQKNEIIFHSPKSGQLRVLKKQDLLVLDFPQDTPKKIPPPFKIVEAIGRIPLEAYQGKTDVMLCYESQKDIEDIKPDFTKLSQIDTRGIIVTAPGDHVDFTSRFFAPGCGINEDPVTGSAHTTLTPYWAQKLGKKSLTAMQLSKRQGKLVCQLKNNRVYIAGQAVTYLRGEITL
jgi:PhzF family phenazine biosynthesis protein